MLEEFKSVNLVILLDEAKVLPLTKWSFEDLFYQLVGATPCNITESEIRCAVEKTMSSWFPSKEPNPDA